MAGARSQIDGACGGLIVVPGDASARTRNLEIPGSMLRIAPEWHFQFHFPRLSKNTPCSPNIFQNHQGMLSRNGRP